MIAGDLLLARPARRLSLLWLDRTYDVQRAEAWLKVPEQAPGYLDVPVVEVFKCPLVGVREIWPKFFVSSRQETRGTHK